MLSKNLNKDTQNTFYRFYRNMKIEFSNFLLDSYTLPLIILASNIPENLNHSRVFSSSSLFD